jgi:hypothetical protein
VLTSTSMRIYFKHELKHEAKWKCLTYSRQPALSVWASLREQETSKGFLPKSKLGRRRNPMGAGLSTPQTRTGRREHVKQETEGKVWETMKEKGEEGGYEKTAPKGTVTPGCSATKGQEQPSTREKPKTEVARRFFRQSARWGFSAVVLTLSLSKNKNTHASCPRFCCSEQCVWSSWQREIEGKETTCCSSSRK